MAGHEKELDRLWSERAQNFRREAFPYVRYMMQSGFPAFLFLLLITASIGYAQLIADVPPDFPLLEVGILCLTPLLSWSPLRTWLHSADIVFLMPREPVMRRYLGHSVRYSVIWSMLLAAAVFLLYAPLYAAGTQPLEAGETGLWMLALASLLIKIGNTRGAWLERRMAWTGARVLFRLLRWGLTAASIGAWVVAPSWQAAIFSILCLLLAACCYRLPAKSHFPWERLIAEERMTRKRYYVFFSLFIDVPVLDNSIARRSYLSWVLTRIPYGQKNTYVYMYAASLMRTEIGIILIRIAAIGCLVTYWAAESAALSGWSAVFSLAVFGFVYSMQLGALRNVNKFTVWKSIYPLPVTGRITQYLKVDAVALSLGFLLLWLFASLPLLFQGIVFPPVVAAMLLLFFLWRRPKALGKKLRTEDEEY